MSNYYIADLHIGHAPLRGLDYFGFVADLEEELNLRISVKLASSIDDQNIIRKRITEGIRIY